MPKLDDDNVINFQNNFGFSHTRIDNLQSDAYTLATIAVDCSGSVSAFEGLLKSSLKEVIKSLEKSPRADNLLVRIVTFNSQVNEIHGFKLLTEIDVNSYDSQINPRGTTSLYDALVNSSKSSAAFAKILASPPNYYTVNDYLIVITDGVDVGSTFTEVSAKNEFNLRKSEESLESTMSYLVGVNVADPQVSSFLNNLKDKVGFDSIIEIENANSATMAKLAGFVSKSISSVSQSLGSGQSQALTF